MSVLLVAVRAESRFDPPASFNASYRRITRPEPAVHVRVSPPLAAGIRNQVQTPSASAGAGDRSLARRRCVLTAVARVPVGA